MIYSQEITESLFLREAVKVQVDPLFTWSSGIKSPVYCDNRKMIAFVEERDLILKGFMAVIEELKLSFDVVAGTATAGIPWAAFLAEKLKKPMVYVRPEKKAHGTAKQIEGFLAKGSRVLLIEDLVSTGGSSLKAVDALREEGEAIIENVLAIVSWGFEGVPEKFSQNGVRLNTLVGFDDVINTAISKGSLSEPERELIMQFRADPYSFGN